MPTNHGRTWPAALSRRRAMAAAGGLAASLATARLTGAQEATPSVPETDDAGERIFTMFVQTAQGGSLVPHPVDPGVYRLTLEGATAQTVYFSDRPHRIVGSVSTADFLAGLGFSEENPPNAAVVVQTGQGEDVLVVELLNPEWDAVNQTLTYDVIVLDEYTGDGFGELAQRQDDGALPETFGHTSLFIDDCPDATHCYDVLQQERVGLLPTGQIPMCWRSDTDRRCAPCDHNLTERDIGWLCASAYPERCGYTDTVWTCRAL
jgi:hypothetical protein